jgi:PAS domain-containing protein
MVKKDGTVFWAQLEATAANNESGVSVSRVVLTDITKSKLTGEALRSSQRQLSDIIKFLPTATMAIDREGRIIIWNKAIEVMTNIPAAEMIGKCNRTYSIPFYGEIQPQLLDLLLEDPDEVASQYPQILREGDSLQTEAFCKALNNNKGAWVFTKASPLHDQDGNVIGAIESIRDISERKTYEAFGELSRRVLGILNEPGKLKDAIKCVLRALKEGTGVDAIGIRLKTGKISPIFLR